MLDLTLKSPISEDPRVRVKLHAAIKTEEFSCLNKKKNSEEHGQTQL